MQTTSARDSRRGPRRRRSAASAKRCMLAHFTGNRRIAAASHAAVKGSAEAVRYCHAARGTYVGELCSAPSRPHVSGGLAWTIGVCRCVLLRWAAPACWQLHSAASPRQRPPEPPHPVASRTLQLRALPRRQVLAPAHRRPAPGALPATAPAPTAGRTTPAGAACTTTGGWRKG